MSKNLYVGNLSFSCTADDLRELFSQHGNVASAQVVSDRETGRSRGFGFVEMGDGGEAAINALNGTDFQSALAQAIVDAIVRFRGRPGEPHP